jgi:anthranilate phosphoribosyltransferase
MLFKTIQECYTMNLKPYLQKLIASPLLSQTEADDLFSQFLDAPIEQQAAALALFASREVSAPELLWRSSSAH